MSFWQANLLVHVFQLSTEDPWVDVMEDNDGASEEEHSLCSQYLLPRHDFQGLWDSLVFDDDKKDRLIEYATSAMLFAKHGVDNHIISWNRVVLLHGPPGTGKTSLCKSLAHKLSIRLSHIYSNAVLLEIHSHSLFSKWFSESGKLVTKLFQHIQELVSDQDSLVLVLIDEVESLTAARKSALSGAEPSDAVRVVNAMLTQLDALKRFPNVMTLCTSNLAEAIDAAFVDRADIKLFVGLPSDQGRYAILRSCLLELMRVGLVSPAIPISAAPTSLGKQCPEQALLDVARSAEGLSGTWHPLLVCESACVSDPHPSPATQGVPFGSFLCWPTQNSCSKVFAALPSSWRH